MGSNPTRTVFFLKKQLSVPDTLPKDLRITSGEFKHAATQDNTEPHMRPSNSGKSSPAFQAGKRGSNPRGRAMGWCAWQQGKWTVNRPRGNTVGSITTWPILVRYASGYKQAVLKTVQPEGPWVRIPPVPFSFEKETAIGA